jgi:hypothetical protein
VTFIHNHRLLFILVIFPTIPAIVLFTVSISVPPSADCAIPRYAPPLPDANNSIPNLPSEFILYSPSPSPSLPPSARPSSQTIPKPSPSPSSTSSPGVPKPSPSSSSSPHAQRHFIPQSVQAQTCANPTPSSLAVRTYLPSPSAATVSHPSSQIEEPTAPQDDAPVLPITSLGAHVTTSPSGSKSPTVAPTPSPSGPGVANNDVCNAPRPLWGKPIVVGDAAPIFGITNAQAKSTAKPSPKASPKPKKPCVPHDPRTPIQINGDSRCQHLIQQALNKLQDLAPEYYTSAASYIGVISCQGYDGKEGGHAEVTMRPPHASVTITFEDGRIVDSLGLQIAIIHEATHVRLYHEAAQAHPNLARLHAIPRNWYAWRNGELTSVQATIDYVKSLEGRPDWPTKESPDYDRYVRDHYLKVLRLQLQQAQAAQTEAEYYPKD